MNTDKLKEILENISNGNKSINDATTEILQQHLLPNPQLIKHIITQDYENQYGTNGSKEDLAARITGAEFIVDWINWNI